MSYSDGTLLCEESVGNWVSSREDGGEGVGGGGVVRGLWTPLRYVWHCTQPSRLHRGNICMSTAASYVWAQLTCSFWHGKNKNVVSLYWVSYMFSAVSYCLQAPYHKNFSKFVRFKKEYYKRIHRNTQISSPFKSVKKCWRNPRILVSKKSAK